MVLSESARMSSAEEYRFRIDAPNSKPRVTKVLALDRPAEDAVRRLAAQPWSRATFFTAAAFASAGNGGGEDWLRTIEGGAADFEKEITTADHVVMIASIGEQEAVAARIGLLCGEHNVMTTGLILDDGRSDDAALSRTLAQIRPYARMLVIARAEDFIVDMLHALRT